MSSSGIAVQHSGDQLPGNQLSGNHGDHGSSQHDDCDVQVMSMLGEHVPLALLCDLGTTDGPTSAEILAEEGEPESQWWRQ
jgi:hypothetical protein